MTQFSIWSSECLLEALLDISMRKIPALPPDQLTMEALQRAVLLIQDLTGVEMNARLETTGDGRPILRRRLKGREHNMYLKDGCYTDAWMAGADMGSTDYPGLGQAAVAFCDLEQPELARLAEILGPERIKHCRMILTFDPKPRLRPG